MKLPDNVVTFNIAKKYDLSRMSVLEWMKVMNPKKPLMKKTVLPLKTR